MKRTELVLKCLKGFMMEMGTWGTNRCSTIQLVVPEVRRLALHVRIPSSFSPFLEFTRSDLLPIGRSCANDLPRTTNSHPGVSMMATIELSPTCTRLDLISANKNSTDRLTEGLTSVPAHVLAFNQRLTSVHQERHSIADASMWQGHYLIDSRLRTSHLRPYARLFPLPSIIARLDVGTGRGEAESVHSSSIINRVSCLASVSLLPPPPASSSSQIDYSMKDFLALLLGTLTLAQHEHVHPDHRSPLRSLPLRRLASARRLGGQPRREPTLLHSPLLSAANTTDKEPSLAHHSRHAN